jgi:diadenosine tetraphosphate (Ap4A) HIT family hydrolase
VENPTSTCLGCDLVAGRADAPGGLVARWPGFVLHALTLPTPLPGWLVLTAERHVRGFSDLSAEEAARAGAIAREVLLAQRRALGAEHGYVVALGEALLHAHVHVIPRYADTPPRLRGARAFLSEPADHRPVEEAAAAARAVARALRSP